MDQCVDIVLYKSNHYTVDKSFRVWYSDYVSAIHSTFILLDNLDIPHFFIMFLYSVGEKDKLTFCGIVYLSYFLLFY